MRTISRKNGFTRIEVLVVAGVLILVLGAVVPYLLSSREKARRNSCRASLKQLGVALHNYHDTFRHFPPGYIVATTISRENNSVEMNWNSGWGWQMFLLPFTDHASLYTSIKQAGEFELGLPTSPKALAATKIPEWRCQADNGSDMVALVKVLGPLPVGRTTTVVNDGFARSNYVGVAGWDNGWVGYFAGDQPISGTNDVSKWSTLEAGNDFRDGIAIYCRPLPSITQFPKEPEYPRNARDYRGIFGENSNLKIASIIDGTSNVIAVGERATPTKSSNESDVGNAIWAGVPDRMTRVGQALSLGTSYWPINHGLKGSEVPNTTGFNSRHWGISNFLCADGQVHPISEKADLSILRKLSIYNDGHAN